MKFIPFILLLFCAAPSFAQPGVNESVARAFNDYKNAILNDKAEEALKAVDSRTKKYYTDLLHDVKLADSLRIDSLPLIDKITILRIRSAASKPEIESMQGTDAFLFAIKNGMVGKSSVANNELGEIIMEEIFAKGQLVAAGQKTDYYFHFYKEEGQWKMDITSLFSIANMAFEQMVKESGEEENKYLVSLLEMLSDKSISADIWKPVIPRQ